MTRFRIDLRGGAFRSVFRFVGQHWARQPWRIGSIFGAMLLATMVDVLRVQRFSTDWHANTFAGSTVRKITRGMWALDLLNDTMLIALFPSLRDAGGHDDPCRLALAGDGRGDRARTVIYIGLTVALTVNYIAPAAQPCQRAGIPSMGGTLADALTCNAVVKGSAPKRVRTSVSAACSASGAAARRTWSRHAHVGTASMPCWCC
jgi:ATP-binding cassette subfamily B protein